MAGKIFTKATKKFLDGTFGALTSLDTRVALLLTTLDPSTLQDSAEFMSDLTPGTNEFNGANYTGGPGGAGRKASANESFSIENANDRTEFTFDPLVWTALGAGTTNVGWAIMYVHNASDASAALIGYYPVNLPATGSNFTLTPHTDGTVQAQAV